MLANRFAVVVSLALSFTLLAPCAAAVVNVQLALNSAGSDASPKGWCDGENSYGKGYTFYWFAVDKVSDCNQWAYQGKYMMWSMPVPNGPADQSSCQADLQAIAAKSLPVTAGQYVCVIARNTAVVSPPGDQAWQAPLVEWYGSVSVTKTAISGGGKTPILSPAASSDWSYQAIHSPFLA